MAIIEFKSMKDVYSREWEKDPPEPGDRVTIGQMLDRVERPLKVDTTTDEWYITTPGFPLPVAQWVKRGEQPGTWKWVNRFD